jgi:hypothetical protein
MKSVLDGSGETKRSWARRPRTCARIAFLALLAMALAACCSMGFEPLPPESLHVQARLVSLDRVAQGGTALLVEVPSGVILAGAHVDNRGVLDLQVKLGQRWDLRQHADGSVRWTAVPGPSPPATRLLLFVLAGGEIRNTSAEMRWAHLNSQALERWTRQPRPRCAECVPDEWGETGLGPILPYLGLNEALSKASADPGRDFVADGVVGRMMDASAAVQGVLDYGELHIPGTHVGGEVIISLLGKGEEPWRAPVFLSGLPDRWVGGSASPRRSSWAKRPEHYFFRHMALSQRDGEVRVTFSPKGWRLLKANAHGLLQLVTYGAVESSMDERLHQGHVAYCGRVAVSPEERARLERGETIVRGTCVMTPATTCEVFTPVEPPEWGADK